MNLSSPGFATPTIEGRIVLTADNQTATGLASARRDLQQFAQQATQLQARISAFQREQLQWQAQQFQHQQSQHRTQQQQAQQQGRQAQQQSQQQARLTQQQVNAHAAQWMQQQQQMRQQRQQGQQAARQQAAQAAATQARIRDVFTTMTTSATAAVTAIYKMARHYADEFAADETRRTHREARLRSVSGLRGDDLQRMSERIGEATNAPAETIEHVLPDLMAELARGRTGRGDAGQMEKQVRQLLDATAFSQNYDVERVMREFPRWKTRPSLALKFLEDIDLTTPGGRFGVAGSFGREENRLQQMGQQELVDEVLAQVDILHQQNKLMQDQYKRENEHYKERNRFHVQLKKLGDALGKHFLPMVERGYGALANLLETFSSLGSAVTKLAAITMTVATGAAAGAASGGFLAAIVVFAATRNIRLAMRAFAAAAGPGAIVGGGLGAGAEALNPANTTGPPQSNWGNFNPLSDPTQQQREQMSPWAFRWMERIDTLFGLLGSNAPYTETELPPGPDTGFGPPGAGTLDLPRRQHGGPVSAGQAYMVGEAGKEMFIPQADGSIAPLKSAASSLQSKTKLNQFNYSITEATSGVRNFTDTLRYATFVMNIMLGGMGRGGGGGGGGGNYVGGGGAGGAGVGGGGVPYSGGGPTGTGSYPAGLGNTPASSGTSPVSAGAQAAALDYARQLEGANELDPKGRAAIMQYLQTGGQGMDPATTAWCAAFVGASLQKAGMQGTGSNVATSYAAWGEAVPSGAVAKGDVLVQMGSAKKIGDTGGHVGFATGNTRMSGGKLQYEMYGGNQSNAAGVQWVNADSAIARRAPIGVAGAGAAGASTSPVASPGGANLPAGMRNNNPGNLKYVSNTLYPGITGPSQNTDQGDPQAVFDTAQSGMNAAAMLAMKKYNRGLTTLDQIMYSGTNSWTPGNPQAPINMAKTMGISANAPLDLNNPATMQSFLKALVRQEHGAAGAAYSDEMYRAAAQSALGGETSGTHDGDLFRGTRRMLNPMETLGTGVEAAQPLSNTDDLFRASRQAENPMEVWGPSRPSGGGRTLHYAGAGAPGGAPSVGNAGAASQMGAPPPFGVGKAVKPHPRMPLEDRFTRERRNAYVVGGSSALSGNAARPSTVPPPSFGGNMPRPRPTNMPTAGQRGGLSLGGDITNVTRNMDRGYSAAGRGGIVSGGGLGSVSPRWLGGGGGMPNLKGLMRGMGGMPNLQSFTGLLPPAMQPALDVVQQMANGGGVSPGSLINMLPEQVRDPITSFAQTAQNTLQLGRGAVDLTVKLGSDLVAARPSVQHGSYFDLGVNVDRTGSLFDRPGDPAFPVNMNR